MEHFLLASVLRKMYFFQKSLDFWKNRNNCHVERLVNRQSDFRARISYNWSDCNLHFSRLADPKILLFFFSKKCPIRRRLKNYISYVLASILVSKTFFLYNVILVFLTYGFKFVNFHKSYFFTSLSPIGVEDPQFYLFPVSFVSTNRRTL